MQEEEDELKKAGTQHKGKAMIATDTHEPPPSSITLNIPL